MSDWYDAARTFIKTKVTIADNSFGGLMAAWFNAGAPTTSTPAAGSIVNSQVSPTAAIAASKLDFTGVSGYNASGTFFLKVVNGVLTWSAS